MRALLADYDRLAAAGPVGRAVVTSIWGSAPQGEGAVLLATATGEMAGSVSGGCVEAAVVEEIRAAIAGGAPRLVQYGVSHERAWEVGLSCGGTLEVLIQPAVPAAVLAAARSGEAAVVATPLAGPAIGQSLPFDDSPAGRAPEARDAAAEALRTGRSRTVRARVDGEEVGVLLESLPRPPRLVVFGGVHIAAALVDLARTLGYYTIVADGRAGFLTRERFPEADELILAWPEEALARAGLDATTAVVVLTHDPKFDDPALQAALRSEAGYIGALGSRKTQESRRGRLRAAGFDAAALARLHGPIGLDLGGRTPAETALAILAEITAHRYGAPVLRSGG